MIYLAPYKSFKAVYAFSDEVAAYIGTVVNCEDKILFSGRSPGELIHAFKQSIDLYLSTCKSKGKKSTKDFMEILKVRGISFEQRGLNMERNGIYTLTNR